VEQIAKFAEETVAYKVLVLVGEVDIQDRNPGIVVFLAPVESRLLARKQRVRTTVFDSFLEFVTNLLSATQNPE
jgi:hypothetical protein